MPGMNEMAWIDTVPLADGLRLAAGGLWTATALGEAAAALERLGPVRGRLEIDLDRIERLDTAGAWLIHRATRRLAAEGTRLDWRRARPDHQALIELVQGLERPVAPRPKPRAWLIAVLNRAGWATAKILRESRIQLGFLGRVVLALARASIQPHRLRWTALAFHLEQTGLNAMPIVALISFLIGVVLAYQGASQLQQFGASIFVVDLVGVSVLREIGILLTAIVVAGRSGSAFTAAIGSMKLREEIDAMRTLGLDPLQVLVVPRVIALVLALPALTFLADCMGLLGGMLMSWIELGIRPFQAMERFQAAVDIRHFWIGMIKAPVFAFLIALVGCFNGLRVKSNAESLGKRTTRAVVEAIFLVIVADAAFSIILQALSL